jgi:exopolysaccharide production protein ExoZ
MMSKALWKRPRLERTQRLNPARPHIVEVQYLRAMAVVLVMIAHLHQSEARFFSDPLLGDFGFTGFIGVDVFFVISGFIIHHLYRTHSGFDFRFLLNRFNRIYPLYWVFSLAAIAGYFVMEDSLTSNVASLDLIGSFSLIPTGQPPILMVGWTLTHELYFYTAYGLMLVLPNKWRPWAVGFWVAPTLFALLLDVNGLSPWLDLFFSPFNLLFLAGGLLAEYRIALERMRVMALASMVTGGLIALGWTQAFGFDGLTDPANRVLFYFLFAFATVWSVLAWKPVLSGIVARIGDWSYALYLSHILVIGVLSRLLVRFIDGEWWTSPVYYGLTAIACLVVGGLAHLGVERPLLKLGKQLIGKVRVQTRQA